MPIMKCRSGCGVCCIEPSITQPIPGLPSGKAAGELCVNLDPEDFTCRIWGQADYPDFCRGFQPEAWICGDNREQALEIIRFLEADTRPKC